MTNDHDLVLDDISAYALGALSEPDRRRVERHLLSCEICRDELEVYRHVVQSELDDLPAEPLSPDFWPSMRARIERDKARRRWLLPTLIDSPHAAQLVLPAIYTAATTLAAVVSLMTSGVALANWQVALSGVVCLVAAAFAVALTRVFNSKLRTSYRFIPYVPVIATVLFLQFLLTASIIRIDTYDVMYIGLDATSTIASQYPSVVSAITAKTSNVSVSGYEKIGLLAYRGSGQSTDSCSDTTTTISIQSPEQFIKSADIILTSIQPSGDGSLLQALETTLRSSSKNRGKTYITMIVGGAHLACDSDDAESTKNLESLRNRRVGVAIIGVGDIQPLQEERLVRYAQAAGGTYQHVSKPEELTPIVRAPVTYYATYFRYGAPRK